MLEGQEIKGGILRQKVIQGRPVTTVTQAEVVAVRAQLLLLRVEHRNRTGGMVLLHLLLDHLLLGQVAGQERVEMQRTQRLRLAEQVVEGMAPHMTRQQLLPGELTQVAVVVLVSHHGMPEQAVPES